MERKGRLWETKTNALEWVVVWGESKTKSLWHRKFSQASPEEQDTCVRKEDKLVLPQKRNVE